MQLELAWRVRVGRECRHCGEMRRSEMKRNRRSPDGHAPLCRPCAVREAKDWATANKERQRAYHRVYSAVHAKKKLAATRAWVRDNPAKARALRQKRKARLLAATVEEFLDVEIFERDGYVCAYCLRLTDPSAPVYAPLRTVLEHKIPLSRGGDHSRANTTAACWECNSHKGSMTDAEFMALREVAA